MKFSMFFMAEYANLLTSAALMATLFFGGWDIPFFTFDNMRVIAPGVVMGAEPAVWKTLLTFLAFVLKTFFFIFMFMWIRWTVPRFRYDQIMHLGWKVVLPSALAFIVVISTSVLVLDGLGVPYGVLYGLILTAVNLVCMALFFWLVDRDRVIGGSYGTEKVRALRAGRMARGVSVEPAPVRPAAATNK
jgi:NADH-quinone oxidoreductase subunit H